MLYRGLSCRESISVRKWRRGNFRAREVPPARKLSLANLLSSLKLPRRGEIRSDEIERPKIAVENRRRACFAARLYEN